MFYCFYWYSGHKLFFSLITLFINAANIILQMKLTVCVCKAPCNVRASVEYFDLNTAN